MTHEERIVYGGVDTHEDVHVGAVIDATGRLLGTKAYPTTPLGLRGKACIHPSQVPVVNRAFTPSESEVAWAWKVLDAYEGLDGELIDLTVVARARRLLAETERR